MVQTIILTGITDIGVNLKIYFLYITFVIEVLFNDKKKIFITRIQHVTMIYSIILLFIFINYCVVCSKLYAVLILLPIGEKLT